MKRLFALFILCCALLCACGQPETTPSPSPSVSASDSISPSPSATASSPPSIKANDATAESISSAPSQSDTPIGAENPQNTPAQQQAQAPTEVPSIIDDPPIEVAPQITAPAVSISVCDQNGGVLLSQPDTSFTTGESVLDVLVRLGKESQLPVVFSGGRQGAYVEGIAGIFEFDFGPTSGWIYSVNGIYPQQSCGSYILSEGDVIQWEYSVSKTTLY